MFSTPSRASGYPAAKQFIGAYQEIGVQTTVGSASAHHLVTMLFDGFFGAINRARGALRSADPAAKGKAISHAVRIVDEGLKATLNMNDGGKLAADLSELYAYICVRLTQANARNDELALDECVRLMQPLREAWVAIGDRVDGTPARN